MLTTNPFTTDNYMKAVDELKAVITKQADEIEELRQELNLQKQRCELWKENSVAGAEEIERLREYERLVKFIASDYIELSHEKAQWQRDDWYKRCRAIQQKGTER